MKKETKPYSEASPNTEIIKFYRSGSMDSHKNEASDKKGGNIKGKFLSEANELYFNNLNKLQHTEDYESEDIDNDGVDYTHINMINRQNLKQLKVSE